MTTRRVQVLAMVAALVVMLGLRPGPAAAAPAVRPKVAGPQVTAKAALLADPATGVVMWQRNPTVARAPASLTKMMTAITAKASLPMTRRLIVSPSADRVEASHLHLGAGHDITVAQALTALMMISANDMAVVLAQHSAGSVRRFSQAMDAQGRRLGLSRSRWRNPNGLDARGHVSSAFDLAILTRAVLRDRWLAGVASRRQKVAFKTPEGKRHTLWNRGRFLRTYKGAIGVKTGFTDHAGRCLAAAATRNGRTLIAVVLASKDPVKDAAALLDWGYGRGRAATTGAVLPPYVAPAGVRELLADQAVVRPIAQPSPTPTPSPAPSPSPSPTPGASGGTGPDVGLGTIIMVVSFGVLVMLTMRTRRRATRLTTSLESEQPRAIFERRRRKQPKRDV
jgi:D-alanyl-D-alanine carboxypeptidase